MSRTRKGGGRRRLRLKEPRYVAARPDGSEAKADEEREGGEKKRGKNNNAASLWEPGSNERKGGSCYKVIRPELMVNKATTACLLTLSKHHSCWGAFNKFSCFGASFLLSPRLQWSITLCRFLHRVPALQSVMTVKHRSPLLYRDKSSRHLSSFPLTLAGLKGKLHS